MRGHQLLFVRLDAVKNNLSLFLAVISGKIEGLGVLLHCVGLSDLRRSREYVRRLKGCAADSRLIFHPSSFW